MLLQSWKINGAKTIILYLNVLLDLQAVHWDTFLPHVEDLKIVIDTRVLDVVPLTLGLGIPGHFDTKVVTTLLPNHLTVGYVEQVLCTDLLGRNVALLDIVY